MKEFDLEPGEFVVRETRKHWLLFVASLLPYALLAALPYLLLGMLSAAPSIPFENVFGTIDSSMHRALTGTWLLLVWTAAWGTFTRYYLNLWVLTNDRVVAIKQRNFFSREVSSLPLTRVQDVTSDVHGIIASLFGIGGITVQSAGAEKEFVMRGIPDPESMRDLILRHIPEGDGIGV